MKIIEQSHEILHMDGLDRIERAGRTCYKSEDKIGCVLDTCISSDDGFGKFCSGAGCGHHSSHRFIQQLIKRGHEAMLEHGSATVKFITNRGVTHELVRHRVASFGQESTRYVNYGGKEVEFIRPVWCPLSMLENIYKGWGAMCARIPADFSDADMFFIDVLSEAEKKYHWLLEGGWRPEQAREVLPNALKTEIVVTANYREWRHILKLRAIGTTGKPHPQMQALMLSLLEEFKARLPALFADLEVK